MLDSELNEVADQFPEEFLKHRILPELLKSVEFGGGGPKVFKVVLQIASKLSEEDYERQVVPVIVRLFASPDRALRVCLLDALPITIDRLPKSTLNDKIFPSIVSGFSDVAPLVRERTVMSILTIITKLSDRTINGELLKHLAKTSNDAEPGIRTNTTICLGKIAKYLGPSTRTKVLVAAFTRSLKDPFVHARNAAILALGATVDNFSEDDCANRLLPALCPSLLDKEKMVRDQAMKVVDQYVAKIKKHTQTMPDSVLPPPTSNPTSAVNGGPRIGTPAQDSSWAGWAISSFTTKLSSADGTIQPNAKAAMNGVHSSRGSNATNSSSRPSTPSAMSQPIASRQAPPLPRQMTETTQLARSFAQPDVLASEDNWGDQIADEAWGTMDDEPGGADDEFDAPSTVASNRSSVTATTIPSRTSRTNYDDGGEPDFAGWLKAQQSTKSKKAPLPKGLTSSAKSLPATSTVTSKPTSKTVPASKASQAAIYAAQTTTTNSHDETDDWGDAWT